MAALNLTMRDLQMIAASTGDRYAMTIHQNTDGLWAVKVKFEEREIQLSVEKARGGSKVWRNMKSAIEFVQNNCKFASDIFVEIGDWTLVRMHKGRVLK